MVNPTVKKGDKIIIMKANNGANDEIEGRTLEVTTPSGSSNANGYFSAKLIEGKGQSYSIFFNERLSGRLNDEFVLASRSEQAKWCRTKAAELKKQHDELVEEASRLEKFEDDESEVADKLNRLMAKKGDVKAMAEILKELKQSHYL
jgi:thiamine biosynthesis lipoprotein ApbE